MEACTKYARPLILYIEEISLNTFSNWLLEAMLSEWALNEKWACAIRPTAYASPLIRSLIIIWYNPDRIIKYKRCCEIKEATHVLTLNVNLFYIVYIYTQNHAPVAGPHGKLGPCPRPWRGGGTAHRINAVFRLGARYGGLWAWHKKGEGGIRNGALKAIRRSTGPRPEGADGERASGTTTKILSRS